MHNHHHHDPSSSRIGIAFFLNVGFTIIEFIGGYLTNSTAIIADAVHDLGDSLSIGMAWLLNKLGNRQADSHYTYGLRRVSLLGALINSLTLIVGSVLVLIHAIPRLFEPQMPTVEGMFALALLGVLVNGYAALKLSRGKSLNEKVLNWHLLEDVLGWLAVLIVSIILMFFNWPILDPVLSIAFTLFILINVLRTLRTTLRLFLQASPDDMQSLTIRRRLLELPHVQDVHHLHLWSLDGERHVLTAHIVLNDSASLEQYASIKQDIVEHLAPFHLEHTTIEIELADEHCRDQPNPQTPDEKPQTSA